MDRDYVYFIRIKKVLVSPFIFHLRVQRPGELHGHPRFTLLIVRRMQLEPQSPVSSEPGESKSLLLESYSVLLYLFLNVQTRSQYGYMAQSEVKFGAIVKWDFGTGIQNGQFQSHLDFSIFILKAYLNLNLSMWISFASLRLDLSFKEKELKIERDVQTEF